MDLSNLHRLRMFVEVADTLSFTEAGRRLFTSQPGVSRQIRELEESTGVALFYRAGRGVALTEAGQALLGPARQMVILLQEIETSMEAMRREVAGHLKLGASSSWEYVLPGLMADFKREHPKVLLSMSVGDMSATVEDVLENRVHLGFVGDKPDDPCLDVVPLIEDEVIIICAPGHELAGIDALRPEDIKGPLPFVQGMRLAGKYLESLQFERVTVMELQTVESVKAAVRSGIGLGMISRNAIAAELASGTLREVRLAGPPFRRFLFLIRNQSRPASLTQRTFLTWLTSVVGPPPRPL